MITNIIDDIEGIKEFKEKFYSKDKSSITNEEIRQWFRILEENIEPLKRRYSIFSICQNFKIIIIFISLTILNSAILALIDSFGFHRESTSFLLLSIIISGIFWGGMFLLYLYIIDYTNYISEAVNKEMQKMRDELYYLIRYQIDLIDVGLKRNTFLFKKHIEKSYKVYQKLFDKLSKEKYNLF